MRQGGRRGGGLAVGPRSRYLRETARPSVFSRRRFDGRPPPEFQRGERTRAARVLWKISINSANAPMRSAAGMMRLNSSTVVLGVMKLFCRSRLYAT